LTSGCAGTASATVHPLPDFCTVAAGCYTACYHDTLCGPTGLASYQWLLNGAALPGATYACYEPLVSGEYQLVATNAFGCTDTTEVIDVALIECPEGGDCEVDLLVEDHPQAPDNSCCFALSYVAGPEPIYGIGISCAQAELVWQPGGLDPSLQPQLIMPNALILTSVNPGSPLPANLVGFIALCLQNVTATPQQVIVDWYDEQLGIFCSDTLAFQCPVEPDCLYVTDLDAVCIDEQVADLADQRRVAARIDRAGERRRWLRAFRRGLVGVGLRRGVDRSLDQLLELLYHVGVAAARDVSARARIAA
jgi:hypothetical protein